MYTITTTTRVKPTGDSSKPLKIQVYIFLKTNLAEVMNSYKWQRLLVNL